MPNPFSFSYPSTFFPSSYGTITANTNFCELDHQFSRNVAELINTLSNATYLYYGYLGLSALHKRKRLAFTTALPHIGLICVGLGSGAYHATLLKEPQLADEIGMAIPTGAVMSRLLSFQIRDPAKRDLVYMASALTVAAIYVVHCVVFTNWIHYPVWISMIAFIGQRCRTLIHRIKDPAVKQKVVHQGRKGRALFVGAFILWLIDRRFCGELIRVRNWLGLPWGWLLELHGWWHVGTGMGAFVFIQLAEYLSEGGPKRDPGNRLSPFRLS